MLSIRIQIAETIHWLENQCTLKDQVVETPVDVDHYVGDYSDPTVPAKLDSAIGVHGNNRWKIVHVNLASNHSGRFDE